MTTKVKDLQKAIAAMEAVKAKLHTAQEAKRSAEKALFDADCKTEEAKWELKAACEKVRQLTGVPYGYP